jgi:hypothetical protein
MTEFVLNKIDILPDEVSRSDAAGMGILTL